jgi:hypothetical protein
MKSFKLIISLFLVAIAFISCDPNENNSSSQNDNTFAENFGASVLRDFIGQVVDVDNHPIQNATIKIGTSTVQTDVNGVFIINGASVHEKFAYITAKKTGFIDGSRSMVPTSGKNNVKIMLLPNSPLQTIQSGQASEVSIYSGTKVVFDGAFQDENGAAYSGDVQVALFHLTPSDENIDKLMPGMLYAQTQDNKEAVLETYGMLNVELRGSAGQKLNITSGHTAEITIRIDDSQIATAPNSIPLWHFDEAKGYWKEDGTATKVGNKYVGEVSHFSWWNCDDFSSLVTLTVTVHDSNGNPISNVGVSLNLNSINSSVQFTDNDGQVSGIIPANQLITLNIQNECGELIYTSQIGPFSQDTDLESIQLSNSNVTKVSGSLIKCDDTIVMNGYVLLKQDNNILISGLNNGNYHFTTLICSGSNNFSIEGNDFDALQTTGELSYLFEYPETHINVLKACNAITEYVTFNINGENTIITNNINSQLFLGTATYGNNLFANQMTIYANHGQIGGGGPLAIPAIAIECGSSLPGNYTINNTSVRIYTDSPNTPNSLIFAYGLSGISNYSFRINKFGAVGDYIDATFSGTINYSQNNYVVTGSAHVLRY